MRISGNNEFEPHCRDFWREVLAVNGSITPYVKTRVFLFFLWGGLVWLGSGHLGIQTGMGVAPYEIIGVVLALLLVMRTNSGYDRWYEGRKLWGGIVNQSRNLAIMGATYGPQDRGWRSRLLRWVAAFPHAARHSLRGERDLWDMRGLLSEPEIRALEQADHLPGYCSLQVARLLQQGVQQGDLDRFAFMKLEEQRSQLIDHIGGCERIMKTPLARVMSIKIRRFLFLYLAVLPLAIVDKCGMLTPLLTMFVAYPLLSLDQIGIELENPFSEKRLSHLPLGDIGDAIQENVMALDEEPLELESDPAVSAPSVAHSRTPERVR